MKKYNKIKSKTPVRQEEKNKQDYTDTITQIYNEKEFETEYIYVIDPQKKNVLNMKNTEETEILNQTLKMETKTVKIFGNEFNEEKIDLISSEKKIKKKKTKKKKRSVKKDITPYGEIEYAGTVNGIDVGIPTPNGNVGGDNFFLIDYKSRTQKECNGINEPNPIMTEDNYNTFHENELEENNADEKAIEEPVKNEYDEKKQKLDISSTSRVSNRVGDSQLSHRSLMKDTIYPKKLSFDIAEKPKSTNNDLDQVKHDKLRKIRFRNKDEIKKIKTADLSPPKKIENEKYKEKEKEKEKVLENNTSYDNINEKDKEKSIKSYKKKRKITTKKKENTKVNKVILIQSLWRRYKIRKLVKLNKSFEELTLTFNLLMNKRLKTNLQFLFEQMNSIISNDNNNIDNINIINNNKMQKDKRRKKIKTKKIKIKNASGKNMDSSFEKENSFKILSDDKNDNDNCKKDKLIEEDKKLFINNEDEESSFPKNKDSVNNDNNDDYYLLKDHSNNNNKNNNNNEKKDNKIKDNNKDNQSLAQSQKEHKSNNAKTKSKLKLVEIQKKNKKDKRNVSLSFDNTTEKKYTKPEVKPPNLKRHFNKSVDLAPSVNYESIPVISNDFLNMSFSRNKFLTDSLINCHNDELSFISPQRRVSYYKKVIGENPFSKQKSKKGNKTDFSAVKFSLKLKEILSKIVKKNNFYYLIGYLNAKSLLQNLMNIFQKNKKSILKSNFDKFKIRAEILKILENTKNAKNAKKMNKKPILKISNIKPIFIGTKINKDKKSELFNENCIESNELSIMGNCYKKRGKNKGNKINKFGEEKLVLSENVCNVKINNKRFRNRIRVDKNVISLKIKKSYEKEDVFNKKKLKISKTIPNFEISKQIKENILSIDKITDFKIRESYQKENKFNDNKLIMTKCISKVKINKQKIDANNFIIDKIISKFNIRESYNKETKFNNKKLFITKTVPKININKSKSENWKFIIDKVISKFNIRNIKKPKQFIITKLIKESPIINMMKKSINDSLVITRVINNINIKGILKSNNHVINRVNNDCIIDNIDAYNKDNKIKYYYSLIMNNINNLIINNIITDFNIISKKAKSILTITNNEFNIKSNKKPSYIITKNINDYILGNNLLLKYLYNFNQNKLIINKVNHVDIKPEDKTKRQIAYSTSLSKVKSIIIKNIHKLAYPLLINILKKKAFCYHIVKFDKMKIKLMKIMFINNIKNAILEEKYKKIYMNRKFNLLVINRVIKYDINKNNNINKTPEHYVIHKVKLFSMKNDAQSINIKNKNFIKGNVITKKINIFIGDNKQTHNLSIDKNSEIFSKKLIPINSPNSSGEFVKNEKKSKIYISRLKMSNTRNYNNLNNITNILKNKNDNKLNNINNNNQTTAINNNPNNKNNLANSHKSINSNILSNTFTSMGTLSKMKQYFPLYNSPPINCNKIIYSKKKANDEKAENKSNDKAKKVKEKQLDFNRNIYKDMEEIQKLKYQKKLLKEITKGQSKEEKEADEQEQEEEEVESTKDNLKSKDKNSKYQQKKYEEKEEEGHVEKIYYKNGNNNKFKNNDANNNNINNKQKEDTYEEEEEEEEFEEEEEESDYMEDLKEILLKYIAKKNNIIYKKLLTAFRKWRTLLNNNPIIYSKNNSMRRTQRKVNKNEIVKDIICDNGAIDKNKKLFMIYRKYNDYSYVLKKKFLRKWKKLIELYDNEDNNDNNNEEIEYDEEEDEEIEDDEEEEEIEKSE